MSEVITYEHPDRVSDKGRHAGRPSSAPAAACATDILILLAGESVPLSTAAIAKRIGTSRSLASRSLSELQSRRLVDKAPDKTYRLGPRVLELGAAYAATQGFGHTVHTTLNELSSATAQTTNLAILVDLDVLYLMKHEGRDSVIGVSQIGSRLPASCTAVGKVLLSCLDDDEIERRYARVPSLPRLTPHSVQHLADLLRDVRAARNRGYAIERDETAVGRTCLAMAVSWQGVPCNRAALGMSMANDDYDGDTEAIRSQLQRAAARLENEAAARLVLEGPNDPSPSHGDPTSTYAVLTGGVAQGDAWTEPDGDAGAREATPITGASDGRRPR